jgi:hypothetical protein
MLAIERQYTEINSSVTPMADKNSGYILHIFTISAFMLLPTKVAPPALLITLRGAMQAEAIAQVNSGVTA